MKRILLFLSSFLIAVVSAAIAFAVASHPDAPISAAITYEKTRVQATLGSDGAAQMKMARYAFQGEGTTKDETAGAAWVMKAAESGHSRAKGLLGVLYLGGIGVTQDFAAAQKWLGQANDLQAQDLAIKLAMFDAALEKLPPEERQKQSELNAAAARADIRASFEKMLEEVKNTEEE